MTTVCIWHLVETQQLPVEGMDETQKKSYGRERRPTKKSS
jgi:hypothetical protein